MADLDLVSEAVVVVRTEGAQQAVAATERVGDSVDRLANSNERLAASDAQVAAVSERSTRYKISAAAAAERLQRQLDAEYRTQKQMAEAMRDLQRARQQGLISASREAELITLAQARYSGLASATVRATAANENHARTTGIASHQLQNLSYQLSDVATSLAGGASAFQVFSQQAGQIAPILAETGVSGAIRGVGSAIGRFLTPTTVGLGALAGAAIYAATSWNRFDDETRRVDNTLAGLGRNLGLTRAGFDELAKSAASASNLSTRQASDFGLAFAATGKIGAGNIKSLIGLVKDTAVTFGITVDEAKAKLADAFSSPAGIERLNAQIGFLDAKTQHLVTDLFQQGKAQEAIAVAVGRLPPALAKAEHSQGLVAGAWEKIKNAISDADLALGKFLDRSMKPTTLDEKVKSAEDRVKALQAAENAAPMVRSQQQATANLGSLKQPSGELGAGLGSAPQAFRPSTIDTSQSRSAEMKAEALTADALRASYEKLKDAEAKAAQQKALEKGFDDQSNALQKLLSQLSPGTDEFRTYTNYQTQLNEAMKSGNTELLKRLVNVKDYAELQSMVNHAVETNKNAEGERMTLAEKASRQREIEISGARAVTTADKARVAQMQVEERQRGQLVTASQAQADAAHAAQMVQEQEAAQLRSMLRDQGLEADEIRKRIALIDVDAETRAVAVARQKTEQDLTRQGIDLNGELAQSVIRGAEANARLGVSYDKAVESQRRMQDAQREVASEFAAFADDVLLGSRKMGEAFASLSKTFASGSLKALLTGEGPLAGLFGTQAGERGQLGGLFGQLTFGSGLPKGFKEAISEGTQSGNESFWSSLFQAKKDSQGASGGAGGLMGMLGGPVGAAFAGGAIGYSTKSPVAGALGGGLAGFSASNDDDQREIAA